MRLSPLLTLEALLKVILSTHAVEGLELRGIDRAWVEATVANPDHTAPDPRLGRTRSYKAISAFGARVLRVVHCPAEDGVRVISAYFDRGARL